MHGKGTFRDNRLNDPVKYPIAVENSFWNVSHTPDLITSKLMALREYQHSIPPPDPPAMSYDHAAAKLSEVLFYSKAKCYTCHTPALYSIPEYQLRSAEEIGIDDFEAKRSPTGKYRTTPLGGLFARAKGGFYHDGRFPTLPDVVNHYDDFMQLKLTDSEKQDVVEYLKSL
jgi:cytochrome c peroxidase